MKRFIIMLVVFLFSCHIGFANQTGFSYMLSVMNIPQMNQNGLPINEEIYQKYQLFVYGTPEMMVSRTKVERCFNRQMAERE